jgi:glycerol-3-phosphate dehydrogenase (NAD(P)+)
MKVLTLWLWAFGFAINKLIGDNNPDQIFYAFELNKEVVNNIRNNREHPFFFEWYKLPENIEIIDDYDDIIWEIDLLILAIPAQFVHLSIDWFKNKIKPGITILNLAKWIDIKFNTPISKVLEEWLKWKDFNYAVLSWWMIASEVVEWKELWADLWIADIEVWKEIKKLLENENFKIKIREDILNIELYWSLKNIMAIMVWYYEGQGLEKSTIWFKLVEFYDEMREIIALYGWNKNIDFSYYSLGWDIVATCFWNSRNRYFGQLLWKGNNINEALDILKKENKHAEGYETLKAVYEIVKDKEWFENIKFLYGLIK